MLIRFWILPVQSFDVLEDGYARLSILDILLGLEKPWFIQRIVNCVAKLPDSYAIRLAMFAPRPGTGLVSVSRGPENAFFEQISI